MTTCQKHPLKFRWPTHSGWIRTTELHTPVRRRRIFGRSLLLRHFFAKHNQSSPPPLWQPVSRPPLRKGRLMCVPWGNRSVFAPHNNSGMVITYKAGTSCVSLRLIIATPNRSDWSDQKGPINFRVTMFLRVNSFFMHTLFLFSKIIITNWCNVGCKPQMLFSFRKYWSLNLVKFYPALAQKFACLL